MSREQITTPFHPALGVPSSLRQDSPRPKTSSENLVCHALKRLHLNSTISDKVTEQIKSADVFHKIPSPRPGKSRHFTLGEKIDALEQALVNGIPATSRRLNIPSYTLATWRKDLADGQGRILMRSIMTERCTTSRKLNLGMEPGVIIGTNDRLEMRKGKKETSLDQLLAKMGKEGFQAKRGHLTDFMTRHGLTLGAKERKAIEDTDTDIGETRTEPPVANDDGGLCCDAVVSKQERTELSPCADDTNETEDSDFYCMRG